MTKEQQIKIQRCIDEFYSNRPQVRDELGGALQVLYEAEPIKHGRWLPYEFATNKRWRKCSVCGTADEYINEFGLVANRSYCPNCGAKMDLDEAKE